MSFLWGFGKSKYWYYGLNWFFVLIRVSFLTGMYVFALLSSLILLILYINNCVSQKLITNLLVWCMSKAVYFFGNVGAITMMRAKAGGCTLLLPAVSEMSRITLWQSMWPLQISPFRLKFTTRWGIFLTALTLFSDTQQMSAHFNALQSKETLISPCHA